MVDKSKDEQVKPELWSQVVQTSSSITLDVLFDYLPMPEGVTIVSPPDNVLKKGLEKFKNSVVGTFTKGALF